ncbi:MAG TPA: hypothetical protein VJ837_03765 [Candidatus Paceibacterota bacterium]|nr:hypothetical protein [Candidatus Paceibacterota bacterium]
MNERQLLVISAACALASAFPLTASAALVPGCEGPTCNFGHFIQLIKNVMGFLLVIAVPIFAILFSWAGFLTVTAMGKMARIEKAKSIATTAFIGFGIALGGYLFVNLMTNFFLKGSPDVRDIFGNVTHQAHEIV